MLNCNSNEEAVEKLENRLQYEIKKISNNGPKIPTEVKERMFEKFYTTKARRNGSGLGLSIVKSVLEEHGAQMTLESTDDWTTFSFVFRRLNYETEKKNEVEIELM